MSLRRFDGWEPRETTRHHYRKGRLVRSVTVREPEFDDDDRAWFLALAYWRDTRCPHCGNDIRDCTAPEEQMVVDVPPPRRCRVTDEISLARATTYKDTPRPHALLFRADLRRR